MQSIYSLTDFCVLVHLKIIHKIQRLLLSIYIPPVFISSNIFFNLFLYLQFVHWNISVFTFQKLEMNIIKNPNFPPPVLFGGIIQTQKHSWCSIAFMELGSCCFIRLFLFEGFCLVFRRPMAKPLPSHDPCHGLLSGQNCALYRWYSTQGKALTSMLNQSPQTSFPLRFEELSVTKLSLLQ